MPNYFLLDNGTLSNLAPQRYSERSISAVICVNENVGIDEAHMRVNNTQEALEEMSHKGKKETLDNVIELMHKASFFRASIECPC